MKGPEKARIAIWQAESELYHEPMKGHHSVSKVYLHLSWSTKRRQPLLRGHTETCLVELRRAAAEHGLVLLACSVLEEHVHILCKLPSSLSAAQAVRKLKSALSCLMAGRDPRIAQGKLWSRGYFAESVGWKNPAQIAAYVCRQREHHEGEEQG